MRPLRDHIKIAVMDLEEILCRTDGEIRRDLPLIRRKLLRALEDERAAENRRIAAAHYAPLSAEEIGS